MRRTVLSLIFITSCLLSYAGNGRDMVSLEIGTFHSPKGFGISFERPTDKGYVNSISAIFDMAGILMGEASSGGGRLLAAQLYPLREWASVPGKYQGTFYAGPAFTGGYLRDDGNHMGLMAGIGAVLGISFSFQGNFSISIETETDAAAHLSYDHFNEHFQLGLYDNGFRFAFYPQIKIMYRL